MNSNRNILILILVVVLGIGAYVVLNTPEHRTVGEKIGDAVDQLQDKTPAERIKDDLNGQ